MHRRFAAPVVGRTSVLALERELLVLDDFGRRHECAAGKARGTFEGRRAAKIPDALQIWMAVRDPRRCPLLLGARLEADHHESRGDHERNSGHGATGYTPSG